MMNDTFDNLTFSNITINLKDSALSKPEETEKEKTKGTPSTDEISFDDSLFLNSQELGEISKKNSSIFDNFFDVASFISSQSTQKTDKTSTSDQSQTRELNNSALDDLFASPPPKISTNSNPVSPHILTESSQNTPKNTTRASTNNSGFDDLFASPSPKVNKTNLTNPSSPHVLKLSSWGLPESILEKYHSRKVVSMFPWQVECLNNPKVLKEHRNLVYSAPTSAGKTLVAEVLAIKTVLERKKKVIFILPFVSVVREKMFYFQDIFSGSGVRVEGFMGAYNPPGGFQSVQFAVCTIEKANSLINHFLQDGTLTEIGAVIIDEMHLLGESHRGYILELLLTKLRYVSLKDSKVDVQIIGMSATLPNLETLARWLDAELYITNFRPIPLYEQTIISGDIYDTSFTKVRQIQNLKDLNTDTDNILQLCLETIKENCSVLIFCPTKNWCENLAQQISSAFYRLGNTQTEFSRDLRSQLDSDLICQVLEQLKRCPIGLDGVLHKTVSFGVAFHHAGLTLDERDIVEGAFRSGIVRVLIATSTLSSGVNLPAKRVIIRTPIFHGKPLDALSYRQMIGRAGRMGKDTSGESILVCQKHEERVARALMSEELSPIESCLEGDGKLKRAILEIVASGVASSVDDVRLFTKCTLLALDAINENPIEEALDFLVTNEFLRILDEDGERKYVATSLGKACLSSSIPPEDGLALFTELEKARQCFVLESELHLIYLVTPYSACHQWGNLDWMFFLNLWENLPSSMRKVGDLVGVRESYIVSATRGKIQTNTSKLYHKLLVHKRFFVSLALQDLVNEKPLSEVCTKFSCNRGMLQTLQLTASTFAGMVTSFSKQLGWSTVEILISQFQDRLHFGVSRDLLDLMKLPILNGKSARALFDSGLRTLVEIANSDVERIENVLHRGMPFESGKLRDGESANALKERHKLKNIWITGREGLTEREAGELILKSAREFLRIDMGLKEAKWDDSQLKSDASDVSKSQPSSLLDSSDCSLFGSSPFRASLSLNSSGDFIMTSQDESFVSFKTPKKRPRRGRPSLESPLKRARVSEEIEIVDVCSNEDLFAAFRNEVNRQSSFALALACSEVAERKRTIGLTQMTLPEATFVHENRKVEGFAMCWDGRTSYYLDLSKMEKAVDVLRDVLSRRFTVVIFDAKDSIKVLKRCCRLDFGATVEDPKLADWLLEPEGREKSLQAMVRNHCPHLIKIAQLCGNKSVVDFKLRSSVECLLSWHCAKVVREELARRNLSGVYTTELGCLRILARMEVTGMGADKRTLAKLAQILTQKQEVVQNRAYSLAGRRFSFSSAKEVAKIVGLSSGRKVSTKKQVLENCGNPISDLVLNWRKIHCILTKTVQPLMRALDKGRIHGNCIMHTATGRITMHEPNLQNVAKNFDVDDCTISCRDAFKAESDRVLVSADYCQLELRLLAHLSQDETLCKIMRTDGDVFRSVAAKWNKIKEKDVTDDLRQRAKQICYGIIYGMGSKALAEHLSIDEIEASDFMETFKRAYPGIQKYVARVVEDCKNRGFVETIAGRRRFLPHINHRNSALRSQAERQAVNTTIQGSAADLVKKSMVILEDQLKTKGNPKLVLHLHDELLFELDTNGLGGFVPILKKTMEGAVKLSIPFPVKVKAGPSWGHLTEYTL